MDLIVGVASVEVEKLSGKLWDRSVLLLLMNQIDLPSLKSEPDFAPVLPGCCLAEALPRIGPLHST